MDNLTRSHTQVPTRERRSAHKEERLQVELRQQRVAVLQVVEVIADRVK